jgi:hypothetical protein
LADLESLDFLEFSPFGESWWIDKPQPVPEPYDATEVLLVNSPLVFVGGVV